MWEEAVQAYQSAVARSNNHNDLWYYRLGYVLMQMGQMEQAAEAFVETRTFRRAYGGVSTIRYKKQSFLKLSATYVEYIKNLPIIENCILYESHAGKSISCNPLAIFEQVKNDQRFSNFTHVWVMNFDSSITETNRHDNTLYVSRGSDLYLRYLAQVKYLINNNTFPPYFIRRKEQLYLNTWHGTPLKMLGKHIRGGFMEHANATRNFLHATHIISPNRHTTNVILEHYDIKGLFSGKLAETGYPRIDKNLNLNKSNAKSTLEKLGSNDSEKIILYAPTWRGTLGNIKFDAEQLELDLKSMQIPGTRLYFRGHHIFEEYLQKLNINVMIVPKEIDTNDLLFVVDILITDYSSIFFDYMPLGRPIIYYAYDFEEYKKERGLYFDFKSLPGLPCFTRGDLQASLIQCMEQPLLNSNMITEKVNFFPMEDGHSGERAVDFFFFNDDTHLFEYKKESKKKLLFFQGYFIPNGITSSFLSLISHLDKNKYDITVVIEPNQIVSHVSRLEKFLQLPDHVRIISRIGATLFSIEERWIVEKFDRDNEFSTLEQEFIHSTAYQREFKRIFGDSEFDVIINFEGYVRFWAYIFSYASSTKRKFIYLHNDMKHEMKERFPYLKSIFAVYKKFDKLISVSASVNEKNKKCLVNEFSIKEDAFVFVNNAIDVAGITEKSKQQLDKDLEQWISSANKLFVTLGRLSPEKGHKKLIEAFVTVVECSKNSKLMILGQGPLKDFLTKRITELHLENNVFLAGLRLNPFPVLARADCFVFSSDYEGQGLAILEALVLGRPVISTDVVGPRSVLENGEGVLVENNTEALAEAMINFIENGQDWKSSFVYENYQKNSIDSFEKLINENI
jgi:CDP-glycerol glycerophosphotransferase